MLKRGRSAANFMDRLLEFQAWEKAEADAGELKAEKERRKEQQLQDAAREIQELK